MEGLQVAIATIVAGIIGGVGLWWSTRAGRKAGVGASQTETITNLQASADAWEERYRLEHDARLAAEQALATVTATQAIERTVAAQDRRDLDDANSRIRLLQRRRGPRADS